MPVDYRKPYDVREVIARIVDGSDYLDFKPSYGAATVCGHAAIEGQPVGLIGNNGPIDSAGSAKAGQFIQLCCQAGVPIVFLQNTTGYLVGVEAETSGIVKHGSKMIQAVTNADVPKITLQIGGSFGAGHYGMCGRAFGPRFLFSWPNARVSVMGGEQAAKVMTIVAEDSARARGLPFDAQKMQAQSARIIAGYDQQSTRAFRDRAALGRRPDRPARQPRRARLLPADLPRGRCAPAAAQFLRNREVLTMTAPLLRRIEIGPHLEITLDDPARQNALSPEMVAEIDLALEDSRAAGLASLTLKGANGVFSAGADLKGLANALAQEPREGETDPLQEQNRAGGHFFARLAAHPGVTIAVVDGAAYGGGMGLAACADIVIATARARFSLSETSLGLPPAQIAPHLIARIGTRHMKRLALTGARFDGREAAAIGLADFYCETDEERDARLEGLIKQIGRCAPGANAETKRLILSCRDGASEDYILDAARTFAACLRGPEGREGVAAFAGKRAPKWAERS